MYDNELYAEFDAHKAPHLRAKIPEFNLNSNLDRQIINNT